MKTVGIDVSSQAKGTACCWVRWENSSATLEAVEHAIDDDSLDAILSKAADKIGVDVPLGWPDAFVEAIARHKAGAAFGETPIGELARRHSDAWVYKNTGQLPLSVTTDRISYPAMRIARILGRMPGAPIDRSGAGIIVEVYPAAALRVWRLQYQRYKRDTGRDVLSAVIAQLRKRCSWLSAEEALWQEVSRSDHAFDALICALIARAHAVGRCHPIPDDQREPARREGWIAVPKDGTLETLVT